ncbi:hypothetical protein TNCV_486221 [Trichonephila clavipes]|nr:hypothetical protein TNCV_486221 [Trichonephila clavipes]
MADKGVLEFGQSSKHIIDANSNDETEMNSATPVPMSSKLRNIMKIKSKGRQLTWHPTYNLPYPVSLKTLILDRFNGHQLLYPVNLLFPHRMSICSRTEMGIKSISTYRWTTKTFWGDPIY